jgi:hypothetical protein
MSLWRKHLAKIAKIAILIAASVLFPAQSADAAITFGTPTNVNQSALSVLNPYEMQASLDGSIIVAATNGYLLKSIDSGTTWTPITVVGVKYWSAVAMNDSGTVIVAAEYGGSVWISTNSGTSFTPAGTGILSTSNWTWLDTNATGTTIVATNQTATVYISTNTGASWTPKAISGASSIKNIAISAVGDKMVLFSSGNSSIFQSNNTGVDWSLQSNAGTMSNSAGYLTMSRDGLRIFFVRGSGNQLARTFDFGVTWETLTAPSSNFLAASSNDDLSKIWLGSSGGGSYYTTDSGTVWTYSSAATGTWKLVYINPTGSRWVAFFGNNGIWTSDGVPSSMTYRPVNAGASTWNRSSISNNGSVIAVATSNGEVSTSQNGGITWNGIAALGRNYWNCLAVSGDGNVVYVGGNNSRIWKSVDKGVTFTPLTGTNLPTTSSSIYGCATNSDGLKFAVSIYSTGIYYSSNGAASLSPVLNRNFCSASIDFPTVTMTSDGTRMATGCSNSNSSIFLTSNSGATWETGTVTAANNFRDVKYSGDGSVLIATYGSMAPQISRDYGATWSPITGVGTNFTSGLSISSDGSMIILGQFLSSGTLYYSSNKGSNFYPVTGVLTGNYTIASVSGDASKLIYGVDGRFINLMSIADVIPSANFASFITSKAAAFRSQLTLTATLSTAGTDGKVTFFANGKKIAGCIKVQTISLVATCAWKPSSRGAVTLSATSYPTDSGYLSASTSLPVVVASRTGNR